MTTEEKKETSETSLEEKRIKKTVIRRRRKVEEPKVEVLEAKTTEEALVVEKPKAEAEVKATAKAKEEAPAPKVKKAKTVEAEKPQAPADIAAAQAKEAKAYEGKVKKSVKQEKKETEEAAKKAKFQKASPKHKKEVTVFGQDAAAKPAQMPIPRNFVGAKRGKKRQQQRGPRRRQQVHANRPLLKTEIIAKKDDKKVVRIIDAITVSELSQQLGVKAGDIIRKLMELEIMATMNQLIDMDSATLIANEYGYEVESAAPSEENLLGLEEEVKEEDLEPRPPVVTIMGHVDHGKTSLLDTIRKTNVASGEAGGITQHIGAYHVHLEKGDITFLDTPGHEAFTAMRARGAEVTDIVIIVVAADDGIMPQTVEAINHAKAAEVPIIVAVNKIDKPDANPEKVKQSMTEHGLVPEDWGGDVMFIEVSAKAGTNITELLEGIILQAEVLELKASKKALAKGFIVEAKLDKGRGPVATVLITDGTLRKGDFFVTGSISGKIRAMINDLGKNIKEAGPGMPVEIIGLSDVPEAGDLFNAVKDDARAKQVATMRRDKTVAAAVTSTSKVSLADLFDQLSKGEVKELDIILKADTQGSIEAVKDAITKLNTEQVEVKVIHQAVGGINEGDVMLASASNALIIGFNVRPESNAKTLAMNEKVEIDLYNVIYNLVDDIKNALEGMLEPIITEEVIGKVEIREVFKVSRMGNVAGCMVTEGKVTRNCKVRLVRENVVIFDGELSSLKRFKDDAKEVLTNFECGLMVKDYNDIKAGDFLECYELKSEAQKLS